MRNPIQIFFASLLAFCLATGVRRAVGVVLIGTTLALVPVQAQGGVVAIVAAAAKVVEFIVNSLGPILSGILSVANAILGAVNEFRSLWERVVYPRALIDQARALAASIRAALRGALANLLRVVVNSATLARTMALEAILRNRSTGDFTALDEAYHRVYQPLPPATMADPRDRDLIDMDDAAAKAMLKTVKEAELAVDQTASAADRIAGEAAEQAPGSAAYLSGAGITAAVHSQAMMMRLIAAELRQEAAKLAHDNARRKRNAAFSEEFRRTGADVWRRR